MRILIALPIAATLASCASQSLETADPIGISQKIDGLQGSPCDCGGIESGKLNDRRENAKEQSAKDGTLNTDIVQGPY